jgi:hypothetical protein
MNVKGRISNRLRVDKNTNAEAVVVKYILPLLFAEKSLAKW